MEALKTERAEKGEAAAPIAETATLGEISNSLQSYYTKNLPACQAQNTLSEYPSPSSIPVKIFPKFPDFPIAKRP